MKHVAIYPSLSGLFTISLCWCALGDLIALMCMLFMGRNKGGQWRDGPYLLKIL